MSTTQRNETKAPLTQPGRSSVPVGKSELPSTLPDFPINDPGGPGPSSGPAPK
jgi:hypothetical protein